MPESPFARPAATGKFQEDISACDRPYGDSPPSNIASYPFQPAGADIRRIRHQLDMEKPGEAYEPGEEFDDPGDGPDDDAPQDRAAAAAGAP